MKTDDPFDLLPKRQSFAEYEESYMDSRPLGRMIKKKMKKKMKKPQRIAGEREKDR